MKVAERKILKQRITDLAQEQFGDLLKAVRFSGPFEEEDLDADLILRERIPLEELGAKLWKIDEPLRQEGYNVLIGHKVRGPSRKTKTKRKSVPAQGPKFGSAKGLIKMSDDFDEPLEDFEDGTP